MLKVRPRQLASVLISIVLIGVPWLVSAAQGCSVQSYANGLCSDKLVLSLWVKDNYRLEEPQERIILWRWRYLGEGLYSPEILVASAAHQQEPVQVSQIVPTPSPVVGVSYLTIQRLILAPSSGESPEPQILWDFGRVAQLEARLRNIDALMRALLEEFFQAHSASPSNRQLTLVLSVDSPGLFLPTQIETLSSFALDERLRLTLSRATITLRTAIGLSSIMGQIELDPKDLEISTERIGVELSLGSASLSGLTTFEHGVGLISQVYSIKAQVGNVTLIGQAVFTSTSQEFTIGASIAGLALSGSSLITPSGFTQSLFIQIPIIVSPPKK